MLELLFIGLERAIQLGQGHFSEIALVIVVGFLFCWLGFVFKMRRMGREKYGMHMFWNLGMAIMCITILVYIVAAAMLSRKCDTCGVDFDFSGNSEFFNFSIVFALFIAFALNVRKSNFVFAIFYTLAQASVSPFVFLTAVKIYGIISGNNRRNT